MPSPLSTNKAAHAAFLQTPPIGFGRWGCWRVGAFLHHAGISPYPFAPVPLFRSPIYV